MSGLGKILIGPIGGFILDAFKTLFPTRTAVVIESEKVGANEQKITDLSAAYDELAKAAAARADADTQRVLRNPDAGKVDPDAAKHFPGVEFRD